MDKIELRPMEKELLRLCKGKHRFSKKLTILELMNKFYIKHYNGDDYRTMCSVMFNNLFKLTTKVNTNENTVREIFYNSFEKTLTNNAETSIERAIIASYYAIRFTTVKYKVGNRYKLRFNIY